MFKNIKPLDTIFVVDQASFNYIAGKVFLVEVDDNFLFIEYQYAWSYGDKKEYNSTERKVIRIEKKHLEADNCFTKMAWYAGKRSEKEFDRKVFVAIGEDKIIRYCKALLLGQIRDRIAGVERAYEDVVKFRAQHYDVLNIQWLEETIGKLGKKIHQL